MTNRQLIGQELSSYRLSHFGRHRPSSKQCGCGSRIPAINNSRPSCVPLNGAQTENIHAARSYPRNNSSSRRAAMHESEFRRCRQLLFIAWAIKAPELPSFNFVSRLLLWTPMRVLKRTGTIPANIDELSHAPSIYLCLMRCQQDGRPLLYLGEAFRQSERPWENMAVFSGTGEYGGREVTAL